MKIENHGDLKSEIERLERIVKGQEDLLIGKLHSLRTSLSPQNLFLSGISSLTGIPLNKSEFVKKGVLVAITFVLQRLLRKSELKIENALADFVQGISQKVKEFFSKKKDEPVEDSEDQY